MIVNVDAKISTACTKRSRFILSQNSCKFRLAVNIRASARENATLFSTLVYRTKLIYVAEITADDQINTTRPISRNRAKVYAFIMYMRYVHFAH
jgi:hypothetical protein